MRWPWLRRPDVGAMESGHWHAPVNVIMTREMREEAARQAQDERAHVIRQEGYSHPDLRLLDPSEPPDLGRKETR